MGRALETNVMTSPSPAYPGLLPDHGRFAYRAITDRPRYRWPDGSGLAVYLALNPEHFAFGEGLGAMLGPPRAVARVR